MARLFVAAITIFGLVAGCGSQEQPLESRELPGGAPGVLFSLLKAESELDEEEVGEVVSQIISDASGARLLENQKVLEGYLISRAKVKRDRLDSVVLHIERNVYFFEEK